MLKKVSNPYTVPFIRSNTLFVSSMFSNIPIVNDMSFYMGKYVQGYNTMSTIPSNHLPYNESSGNGIETRTCKLWINAFRDCSNLTSLPNPFYNMSNCINTAHMFCNCRNIKDFSMVNFGNKVTNMRYTFLNCRNLVNAPVIPNSVTNMYSTFFNCTNLVNAPVIPNSVTSMSGTFSGCSNLVNAPVIPNSVTNMYSTFSDCDNLVNAPVIPNSVTSMSFTFYYCSNLVNTPIIPNSVTDMSYTFQSCSNLTTVKNIGTGVINMSQAFEYCKNIKNNIYILSKNVKKADRCFSGANNYAKNIYVYPNTTTYNTFYTAMGNSTTNASWNATLRTM